MFMGCSKEPLLMFKELPNTYLNESDYGKLPNFEHEKYDEVLKSFVSNCQATKAQEIYGSLCLDANKTTNAKEFIQNNFTPYRIYGEDSLLTAYYEPELHGSLTKSKKYQYPIYKTPKDLIAVDLKSIYPTLKNYRLRGRIEGSKLVPYYTRLELAQKEIDSEVICYCDSKIELFFLEVQGSGRVALENGDTLYVGYDNQNGHNYKSIGKYLINMNEISKENISLQSIKEWFALNPTRVDEVLNHNPSLVFFKERENPASGSLGLELTPLRSVAVDNNYIPLGSMLYLSSSSENEVYEKVVFAQDTGGAIKGSVRADMFLGFGKNAGKIAGELKSELALWIFMPKTIKEKKIE